MSSNRAEEIQDSYSELMKNAKKRLRLSTIPEPKKKWKSAPSKGQPKTGSMEMELHSIKLTQEQLAAAKLEENKLIQQREEVRYKITLDELKKSPDRAISLSDPQKKELAQRIVDLTKVIEILGREGSTHLKPILENILNKCKTTIGQQSSKEQPKITFNEFEINNKDLSQIQGCLVGIAALTTLAAIYQLQLQKPNPQEVLQELEAKKEVEKKNVESQTDSIRNRALYGHR